MNKISDKIINKYLDGELDYEERKATEKLLTTSSKDKKEYLLLQRLDTNLRKMKSKNLSQNFTSDLMNKLSLGKVANKKQAKFILSILTILILPLLLITGTVIYNVFSNYSSVESSIIYTVRSNVSVWLVNMINYISISPASILWICLSSTLSISLYLLFDELSRSKLYLDKIQ